MRAWLLQSRQSGLTCGHLHQHEAEAWRCLGLQADPASWTVKSLWLSSVGAPPKRNTWAIAAGLCLFVPLHGRHRSRTGQYAPRAVDVDADDCQLRCPGCPVSWGDHVLDRGPCNQCNSASFVFRLERLGVVAGQRTGRERRFQAILARHAGGAGSSQSPEASHRRGKDGLRLRLALHRLRENCPFRGSRWGVPRTCVVNPASASIYAGFRGLHIMALSEVAKYSGHKERSVE